MQFILTAAITLTGLTSLSSQVWAQQVNTLDVNFTAKHEACLEKIADDASEAYEDALIWQSQGGGRRARHCVAMALFALGHEDEGAFRLEKLAKSPDGGTPAMRAGYYVESADMWMSAGMPKNALMATEKGLKVSKKHTDLLIAKARAQAALDKWMEAEKTLNTVLSAEPTNARALRYRADARRRIGKLDLALMDIENAAILDSKNIDVYVVRGEIKEAIRLKGQAVKTP
mgnify:CR=1 FL=1